MRGRLGTGKHLDETYVLLPQAVPATGGVTPPAVAGGGIPQPVPPVSGAGDISGGAIPVTMGGGPSDIFGGTATVKPLSAPATSALNLLGKVESWGIGPGTQLRGLNLKVEKLTGAQLQDLLKRLPDGMTYEIGLGKEDA
jgi:hypothetical protein